MVTSPDSDGLHHVFLNLQSVNNGGDSAGFIVNRIALKAESISISTTKNVMAVPLPFSGVVTGESSSLAMDFGVATKNISISGILTEQTIKKKFDNIPANATADSQYSSSWSGNIATVKLTANEVAQLIHSYVDSSFMQQNQNLNKLNI